MSFESVLMMLGGIGMFLYGMKLMGNSLESAAGAKMEKIQTGSSGRVQRQRS